MTSVGQQLRSERERKGLALGQIAAQTRISERYLTAIEADDLPSLPGGFFYRSFVRQYAGALGLDQQELEDQLDRVMPAPPPVVSDAVLHQTPPIRELHPILSEAQAVRESRPLGLQIGVLLLVVAACAGLYAWWDRIQKQPEAQAPVAAETAPSPKPAEQPVAKAPPPQPEPGVTPQASAKPPEPAITPSPGGAVTLTLSSTEDVWVSVNSGGKMLFSGVIQPTQSRTFEALQNASLLVGNAGGLDVQWNGKPLGPIGPRGRVRKVVLTPDKFEIIDPKALSPDKPPQPGVGT